MAISDAELELSYANAAERVRRAAYAVLKNLGPGTEPVAIALDHGARFPLIMMAVLAAGRAYVPLDVDFPIERNAHILSHSGACALIADSKTTEHLRNRLPDNLQTLTPDDLWSGRGEPTLPDILPDAVAYIIYTSGSTGAPKGIVQNQRNLLHDVMQYTQAIHVNFEDRMTLLYSPSVNGAIRDIYGSLLNGATLYAFSLKKLGVSALCAAFEAAGITIYHSVPTIFRQICTALQQGTVRLDQVRLAYLAGDRLDPDDVIAFRRNFPSDALILTGIGSTENATLYRHWFIAKDTAIDGSKVPVGRALPDRHVRLIDDHGNEVRKGEVGEIEVTSRYMALGYHKRSDGFGVSSDDPLARVFRTGDLGRLRPDGLLEFRGRKDDQIKLRGVRIEPAFVEAELRTLSEVVQGAIVVRRCGTVATALVAYWVANPGHEQAQIRALLAERLPEVMVPSQAVRVPSLPLLDNFKINRHALQCWDQLLQVKIRRERPAADPVTRQIQIGFQDILGRSIAENDMLTSLEPDSLQWLQLQLFSRSSRDGQ
ncbi:MAG: AMP-binding protein [Defluviicoccus sp.]|nr:MAG: AMP-binding protein [Defluviicoccus sp.]